MQAVDHSTSSGVCFEIASLSSQLASSDVDPESQEMMQMVIDRLKFLATTPQNYTSPTKFTSSTPLDSPGIAGAAMTSRHILNKVIEHRQHIGNLFGNTSGKGRPKQVEKLNSECSGNSDLILKRFEEWLNRVEKQNSELAENVTFTLKSLEDRLSQLEKENGEQLGNVNSILKQFEEHFVRVEKEVEELKSQGSKKRQSQESIKYDANTLEEFWRKCNESQMSVVNMKTFCLAESHPQKYEIDKLYQAINEIYSQQNLKQYFQQLQEKHDVKLEKLELGQALTEINSLKQQFKMAEIEMSFEIGKLSQCIEELRSEPKKQRETFSVGLGELEQKYDKSQSEIALFKNQFLQAQLHTKYELNCMANNILEMQLQLEKLKQTDIKCETKLAVEKPQQKGDELLEKIENILQKDEESLLPSNQVLNPNVEEFCPRLNRPSLNLENKMARVIDNPRLNVDSTDAKGINMSTIDKELHHNGEKFYPHIKLTSFNCEYVPTWIIAPENGRIDKHGVDVDSTVEGNMENYHMDNHGVAVNLTDDEGNTSLHRAVTNGQLYVVIKLINMGADVNLKNNKKCTPLFCSVSNGHLSITRELLKYGADVDCKNGINETPLHIAITKGHFDIVSELLKNGADYNCLHINQTPLFLAIRSGNLDIVKELIQHGVNINGKSGNCNPLHIAAERGYIDIVKELIKCGADIDYKNVFDETALHSAAMNGHLNIVDELVRCGADINLTAASGQTAMEYYEKLLK